MKEKEQACLFFLVIANGSNRLKPCHVRGVHVNVRHTTIVDIGTRCEVVAWLQASNGCGHGDGTKWNVRVSDGVDGGWECANAVDERGVEE